MSLGLTSVPSEPALRQCLDQIASANADVRRTILKSSADLIGKHAPVLSPCFKDFVPIDCDVSPFDNSGSKKEGVSCTYKLMDGYAPIFAYIGNEGYLLNAELREGKQDCQKGTPEFLCETFTLRAVYGFREISIRALGAAEPTTKLFAAQRERRGLG